MTCQFGQDCHCTSVWLTVLRKLIPLTLQGIAKHEGKPLKPLSEPFKGCTPPTPPLRVREGSSSASHDIYTGTVKILPEL